MATVMKEKKAKVEPDTKQKKPERTRFNVAVQCGFVDGDSETKLKDLDKVMEIAELAPNGQTVVWPEVKQYRNPVSWHDVRILRKKSDVVKAQQDRQEFLDAGKPEVAMGNKLKRLRIEMAKLEAKMTFEGIDPSKVD